MMLLLCYICVIASITSHFVECNEEINLLFSKISDLDEEITVLRNKHITDINFVKASLRSELNQHIKEQVRKAMTEILQGESLEEMVRSQVVSEVRQLKHGHHQMKRQLHHVMKSLRDVEEDRASYKESLIKAGKNASEVLTCSKYVVESKILQRDLEQCNSRCTVKTDVITDMRQDLKVLNETFQSLLNELSESDKTSGTDVTTLPYTLSVASTALSYKPEEERNRIIAVPNWASHKNEFRQINIHSNSPTNYPYLTVSRVRYLAYVSKSRKLLIGLAGPDKIVSSYLDTHGVKTVREGVKTWGMAVDEERELVFLTTQSPRHTISRMSTQGKHFTTIALLVKYTNPYGIAVNTREQKIYSCNNNKLFMVTYDGRVIQTLATGSGMSAVTLDNTGALYYNDDKTLMKMTWSQSSYSTTNVTSLGVKPRNLLYYRSSVYVSRRDTSRAIGVVDMASGITSYNLTAFDVKSTNSLNICLVP